MQCVHYAFVTNDLERLWKLIKWVFITCIFSSSSSCCFVTFSSSLRPSYSRVEWFSIIYNLIYSTVKHFAALLLKESTSPSSRRLRPFTGIPPNGSSYTTLLSRRALHFARSKTVYFRTRRNHFLVKKYFAALLRIENYPQRLLIELEPFSALVAVWTKGKSLVSVSYITYSVILTSCCLFHINQLFTQFN